MAREFTPENEQRRCKAKSKTTGQRCKNFVVPGYKVCRFHGANPNNHGGAPKGNKNALKTGEKEVIWYDKLTPEEKELYHGIDTDNIQQLDEEIRLLSIRERRMLERIQDVLDGWEEDKEESIVEAVPSVKPIVVYNEDGTFTVEKETIHEMLETERKVSKRAKLERILAIEEALTRAQRQKARLIELKYKIEEPDDGEEGLDALARAIEYSTQLIFKKRKKEQGRGDDTGEDDDIDEDDEE